LALAVWGSLPTLVEPEELQVLALTVLLRAGLVVNTALEPVAVAWAELQLAEMSILAAVVVEAGTTAK
jgi:hypothetical protein